MEAKGVNVVIIQISLLIPFVKKILLVKRNVLLSLVITNKYIDKQITKFLLLILLVLIQNLYSQQLICPGLADNGRNIHRTQSIIINAVNFSPGQNMQAESDTMLFQFVINNLSKLTYNQSAVKQTEKCAAYGPRSNLPYFTVRFAVPVPPAYTPTNIAKLTGVDPFVYQHNHSPGFQIMPNGDALSIYFSTLEGKSENDSSTSFVQARLRYGAEDWDMPELFFKTKGQNDQSALLWNDNGKIWFFGGGRNLSDMVPFKIATSEDNGETWTFAVPILVKPATSYTAQPITSAFRDKNNNIYFSMDGDDSESFLWVSKDNGLSWNDTGGRTGGRHSAFVPLDDNGKVLSIGGKNATIDGWTPKNISLDWGASWSKSEKAPFPQLGTAQRPSLIRLASGNLLFVSDSYMHKKKIAPPKDWKYGNNCFVALSADNGHTWHIKTLPVQLPAHHRIENPSLGYTTACQAANGVIHILSTVTLPCLHYELNEAWILSECGDILPEKKGGSIKHFSELYKSGHLKSKWTARICPNGRYLLHGKMFDYYDNGKIQHIASYVNGRKNGEETFWSKEGVKLWSWKRDLEKNQGIWTHYWPNGVKAIESNWNLMPEARDLKRQFYGYLANGFTKHYDERGKLTSVFQLTNGMIKDSLRVEDAQQDWMQNR